ncbi:TPA: hypothetical protein DF272_04725 [Candidatus Falkowbacteria bacterium]|nr:hypothetical protein [Candidatus Falkowbacteria bacterium]
MLNLKQAREHILSRDRIQRFFNVVDMTRISVDKKHDDDDSRKSKLEYRAQLALKVQKMNILCLSDSDEVDTSLLSGSDLFDYEFRKQLLDQAAFNHVGAAFSEIVILDDVVVVRDGDQCWTIDDRTVVDGLADQFNAQWQQSPAIEL